MPFTPPAIPRVLVVEDDAPIHDLLRDVLEDAGYRVLPTDHLLDPVDLQQLRLDLVVLDLMLGGRPAGWDYLRTLRGLPGTAHLPVLVCTGDYQSVRDADGPLLALAADLVLKPFDLDDLLRAVAACPASGRGGVPRAGGTLPKRPEA